MTAFDAYVQAKFHGGTMPGGPTFTVIHDAETPLRGGYCDSIVEFFRKGPAAGTSAHAMVDPGRAVKMLPDNVVAYAAGPYANTFGWHLEQAGYARFSRAEWTTADGMAQLPRVAACAREVHDQWGIPKRWCTDDQLRRAAKGDRSQGGITTHQQVARVLGGTTHTDPEDNYPRDLLLELVLTPQQQERDWFDMASAEDLEAIVRKVVGERADVASLKAVASNLSPDGPWWLTDGITRRQLNGWQEFERMTQLGLAEFHQPDHPIAVIEDELLQRIPIVA